MIKMHQNAGRLMVSIERAATTDGSIHVIAPNRLGDLFAMRMRRNPARVSVEAYRGRAAQKRYAKRWPRVVVEDAP